MLAGQYLNALTNIEACFMIQHFLEVKYLQDVSICFRLQIYE